MFEELDIDWFALSESDFVLHFASGGGFVPPFVNERTAELAERILSLPIVSPEIIINERLAEFVSTSDSKSYELYIESFSAYARRGIFSYDKSILNNYDSPLYHLVAIPSKPLKKQELSDSLLSLITKNIVSINPLVDKQVDIEKCAIIF